MSEVLLEVKNVKKYFAVSDGPFFSKKKKHVKAVDDVSFQIKRGETVGIVGESGCGKSTLARLINRLITPTSGAVRFKGRALTGLSPKEIRTERQHIQMIFQNPYASLDPRKKIEALIMEPLVIHNIGTKKERRKKVDEMLEIVGLSAYHGDRYPHEFSGGQRQRINIARALVLNPELIICDEPVSALDVSIQAQVINLLKDLQTEFHLTYLFIAHDLDVVRFISDRIMVMYLGKVVETGTCEEVYRTPQHPYTRALLSSVPLKSPFEERERIFLQGDVPSPIDPPSGCHFHERCPFAVEQCKTAAPVLSEYIAEHQVSCHLAGQI
ncbi:peptide/nickel transport system ATP-binding protein/oligopeptide transport system ATP-binding protein [Evansella caseinilytica]|uniref:Peptide/nickel transport system ATP-binding protein/oligopeptide transport system ATP-binding protein n=1 Tax=Evansella caseinilytica TaxID=1503961 RepID=A0A1H3HKW4_9BACI|nr:dipeptide ABC transporter ATP-binding protein [Evansella caseinilytica]SDY16010.1 peptide/nickel transport system ATP-binding protein/oligopeptide transport system ATP-binding protein [Evansella caseinilytica]